MKETSLYKARVLGYCMGVRRAVETAYREAREAPGRVYTMGPLIHNPQVLEDLRSRGVDALEGDRLPPDLRDRVVIIRAHGVSPALEAELGSRGARIVDATCPKVKASQLKARSLSGAGYRVFIAGEREHGEVAGIRGYAPDSLVVASPAEAEEAARSLRAGTPAVKAALIGQTTISPEEYAAIGAAIGKNLNLEVVDTICGATRERQEALRELCAQVEAVIIAGGRGSSNTRRLLEIARSLGKPCWLVESAADLPAEAAAFKTLGLSAGASTPDAVIREIESALNRS
ncbi:MAG: 4-hydroxy-3-methylbut-2-enyl diphosphate reductase [Treponema sp.]|jgi:4-hydroxy-3-methylbut-2-enyl diphosphate reductase|nr:4-hydroxy-3-methylbut-2-enyl diphosphate reductase [Treponema sp.]